MILAFGSLIAHRARAVPVLRRARRGPGGWSTSSPCWRWPSSGTSCSATPASSRWGSRASSASASYTLWLFSDVLHINPFIGGDLRGHRRCDHRPAGRGSGVQAQGWLSGHRDLGHRGDPSPDRGQHQENRRWIRYHDPGGQPSWAPRCGCRAAYWWALGSALIAIAVHLPPAPVPHRSGVSKAMRDNDLAAESSGVNLWRIQALHLRHRRRRLRAGRRHRGHPPPPGAAGGGLQRQLDRLSDLHHGHRRHRHDRRARSSGPSSTSSCERRPASTATWYFIVLGLLAIVVTVWSPAGIYGFIVRKTNFFVFPLQRKLRLAAVSGQEPPQEVAAKAEA